MIARYTGSFFVTKQYYWTREVLLFTIDHIVFKGVGMSRVVVGLNDLATTNPDVAAEWHPTKNGALTPRDVTSGSNLSVWWLGKCGHEWKTSIHSRVSKNAGCPYCRNLELLVGFNDLATKYPDLASEWHPEKNGELKPEYIRKNSNKHVWWLGTCGHEWDAIVYTRFKGAGCPYCANKKVLRGFNDLETTIPNLVKQWNYEKNVGLQPSEVMAGSSKKVWWRCGYGHEWESTVNNRSKGAGCPICSRLRKIRK